MAAYIEMHAVKVCFNYKHVDNLFESILIDTLIQSIKHYWCILWIVNVTDALS